jgi:hypothetical protein
MLSVTDTATVTISAIGIEFVALKKLALISHALAERIGGHAGFEQRGHR